MAPPARSVNPPRFSEPKSRHPRTSPLFPYTTLFRSRAPDRRRRIAQEDQRHAIARRQAQQLAVRLAPPEFVGPPQDRSEEHTSELQSLRQLVCRLLLEKKKNHP